ncbi:MAG: Flp family type IVb pilin [Bryobacteraceae bacterium]
MIRLAHIRLWKDTRGQDLIEWALLAGLFSAVIAAGIPQLSEAFVAAFGKVINVMPTF